MPYEYTPPKYAQVIDELRRRIESGEYPPGSLLPSEHQLSDEFQIARPTVVRALRVLRQDGWIETQQGKGSFVRGRPALAGLESQRTGEEALNRDESREPGDLIEAAIIVPPPRVAALLGRAGDGDVLARRLVVRQDGDASEILTWWVPAALAEGTDLADPEPLHGGARGHLSRRKGIRVDHVLEQVTARHPTPQEARLLGVGKSAPMLAMYVTARQASGEPVLVLEVVMPGDRHELEDAYQVA
ncbi:MAG: GntR family transcriptional regulator [Streptosporangiaceae bacterium]